VPLLWWWLLLLLAESWRGVGAGEVYPLPLLLLHWVPALPLALVGQRQTVHSMSPDVRRCWRQGRCYVDRSALLAAAVVG
jgi:hypothetical protein